MKLTPSLTFTTLTLLGFCLVVAQWSLHAETSGFILLLILWLLCALRYKFPYPNVRKTIYVDIVVVAALYFLGYVPVAEIGLAVVLLQGMFLGVYPIVLALGYMVVSPQPIAITITFAAVIIGLILNYWHQEHQLRLTQRDQFAKKNQALELLQSELTTALSQVEQMSILAERARISSDIHDNAGHEIVAAYISLQTVGKIMENNPQKATELFNKSMTRLNIGLGKMRDAVHNMSTVTTHGVLHIEDICKNFTLPVQFSTSGDMTHVTANMWHVLDAVLKESLTNITKHAMATIVRVELDSTHYLIRLLVENDGVIKMATPTGNGLRNMQTRVATVGGTLAVDKQENFKLVCVIPIK